MAEKKNADAPVEAEAPGKYRWMRMGTHPITGRLRHIGDVDELPLSAVAAVRGLVKRVPDSATVGDSPRGEPSRIIGSNISERDYLLGAHLAAELEGTHTLTSAPFGYRENADTAPKV